MIDGHESTSITEFKGLFDRGDDESCLPDHFEEELNLFYEFQKLSRRWGSVLGITSGFAINRWHIYNRTGEAPRLLILDNTGKLWDSAVGFVTPILDIVAMIDFSMITLFNRAYITPHDRNRGIPSEVVYVYQGSGVARPAAGTAPSGFTLGVATSGTAGNVEIGERIFAVVFESDTGYISAPGPAIFTRYTAPGGFAVNFSSVQVGPAGTIKRHIVSSTKLPTLYDGNQLSVEYFFIPNATINDNTTTTLNAVSFYDSQLISSADYLLDQLSSIPAGVGIGKYKGSLVVWGTNASERLIYVSDAGKPESIDGVDNVIEVPDDGGGGVKNCIGYRNLFYIHKQQRSYVVSDSGSDPVFWVPDPIDSSVGTDCFGIGEILDQAGIILDYYVIADRGALRLMDGTFKTELSWKIENRWKRINKAAFNTVQVVVDPILKRIYCAVPLDAATSPSHILVCDFGAGLTMEAVKWGTWTLPTAAVSIGVDVNNTTKKTIFKFSPLTGNVYNLDPDSTNDYGTAIPYRFKTAHLGFSSVDGISQFVVARMRVRGIGSLQLDIVGLDDLNLINPGTILLIPTPGRPYDFKFNYNSTKAAFDFTGGFNSGDTFILNKIQVFGSELWIESPVNP